MGERNTREFYIPCDGINLHAKLDMPENGADQCPLAIVIHGFTGHMEETHIVAAAGAMNEIGIATLRVEMYGHGKSDGAFRDHTLYKWVTNALAVVEYTKSLDFVTDRYICGHSQGGLLVMLLAGMCPDTFKAVIPLAPAWMIPEHARRGSILGVSFDPDHIPDELAQWDGKSLSGNYARVAQTIYPEDMIDKYHGPVLIVQGDADEAVPPEYASKAAKLYDNCRLVVIPGDTHCYDYHLDQVTDAIKQFLKEWME